MSLATPHLPSRRVAKALARTAFHGLVALAGTANAQVSGTSFPSALPNASPSATADVFYGQGMDATTAQRPGTRGLFVATLAALIAQGLGNGVGTALSQGLGGSITKWFGAEPRAGSSGGSSGLSAGLPDPIGSMGSMGPPRTAPSFAAQASSDAPAPAAPQAGVAFEVHLIGRGAAVRPVDPARHVFHTGDRFQLHYRPTLPGRVQVFNVNPQGTESRIDSVEVAAGQLASLGPYRFVGMEGEETLKLVLQPCSSPVLTAATRSIVKVAAEPGAAEPALRVGDCGTAATRGLRAKVRSIGKATMDGATAFAFDPLSADEARSGLIAARELRISLQHQP